MIQTERLMLRPYRPDDITPLFEIFSDEENMAFYPKPYSIEEVETIIIKNMKSYETDRIGFFAVIHNDSSKLIGNCGITNQNIDGVQEYEIGYHIHKNYWNIGYATEAACAMMEYGFSTLQLTKLCSYMAEDHTISRMVAENMGMTIEKKYLNPKNRNLPTTVYSKINPNNPI